MTRTEKIQAYIKGQQLLTFNEWYELNKDAFILGQNKRDPFELYEEYIAEFLGE